MSPRYSLYLDSEAQGEFVVRTTLSPYFGQPLPANVTKRASGNAGRSTSAETSLHFAIYLGDDVDHNKVLVRGSASLDFSDGSTTKDTLVTFNLTAPLETSLATQNVTLSGWVAAPGVQANTTYTAASSELLYLPETTSGGSVTRLDNAHGGFMFRGNDSASAAFRPFFPYGFYASYDGFLAQATDPASAAAVIGKYARFGLNAMTPLTQYPQSAAAFAYMADTDVRVQFDLREGYQNLTWVAEQVVAARSNAALFSYWSADEPDGHQDPFAAPRRARDTIRAGDPYHPVALVLNCADYYFGAYTDGGAADVIMEDVYPIGINASWSKWGTACNATLGDCGCDNCRGGAHAVRDVADRLDALARYEAWLAGRWPRTKIHNPQSFHGEDYWARDPTAAEEWAMALVALNHGAQGIISWVYPTVDDALPAAHGQLAAVLTAAPVVDFVVGNARPTSLRVPSDSPPAASDTPNVDVAVWRRGRQLLVSVVNSGYEDYHGNGTALSIPIPRAVWPAANRSYHSIEAVLWGQLVWSWAGNKLSTQSIPALSTSLVVLSAE